jgi:hypothetical protein
MNTTKMSLWGTGIVYWPSVMIVTMWVFEHAIALASTEAGLIVLANAALVVGILAAVVTVFECKDEIEVFWRIGNKRARFGYVLVSLLSLLASVLVLGSTVLAQKWFLFTSSPLHNLVTSLSLESPMVTTAAAWSWYILCAYGLISVGGGFVVVFFKTALQWWRRIAYPLTC